MREIDFLPEWYPGVRRQRTVLRAQVYVSAAIVFAGIITLLVTYRQCDAAQVQLDATHARAEQTVKEVRQLEEMLSLQKQLVTKQRIIADLGLPVELSRVMSELNDCMPREVSFTEVEFKTAEKTVDTIAERAKQGGQPAKTRRLEMRIKGVAPTESEVTAFWSRLIQRVFFSEVRLVNSVEKRSAEHRWRNFEISLVIPLDYGEPQTN